MNTVARQPIGSAASVNFAPAAPTPLPFVPAPAIDLPEQIVHTESVIDMIKRFANVAGILRATGALIVIASMSAFLLQGWAGGNDMSRYYLLLCQTVLLTGGGFAMSFLLKENKGARVFFGLSLLSATADMTTLGALTFSFVHIGKVAASYPAFASWQATGGTSLLLAGLLGVVALAAISGFSFLVLARRSGKQLATSFFLCNLMLLLPVRESWGAGLAAMLALVIAFWQMRRILCADVTIRTKEGAFAAAALFAPALIIVLRSLFFYRMDAMFAFMLASTGYALVRGRVKAGEELSGAAALVAFGLAAAVCLSLAMLTFPGQDGANAVFGFSFALLGLDVARCRGKDGVAFASCSACVLALSELMPFIATHDTLSICLFILAGIVVLGMGKAYARPPLLVLGGLMLLAGVGEQLERILSFVDWSNWATLAGLGAVAIIAASVIESRGALIKLKWSQWTGSRSED